MEISKLNKIRCVFVLIKKQAFGRLMHFLPQKIMQGAQILHMERIHERSLDRLGHTIINASDNNVVNNTRRTVTPVDIVDRKGFE